MLLKRWQTSMPRGRPRPIDRGNRGLTMLQQILSRMSPTATTPARESKQEESPEARYTQVVRGMLHDAYQQKSIVPLVNVLTWALAGILGRLGGHLRWITEKEAAQAEADAAKRAGVSPQ